MTWSRLLAMLALTLLWIMPVAAQSDDLWVKPGPDGQPQLQLYYFWTTTCSHCQEARPFVEAIPATRPWVALHSMELNGHPEHARQYQTMAAQLGQEAVSVPALLFCGEMHVGWDKAETTGAEIAWRLDECHARLLAGSVVAGLSAGKLSVPILGEVDPQHFSLPLLTVAIAGLDAFNPCAFFVLLFLLSLLAHQKNRERMLVIGGIFVLFSGLMYFAFMAAWLNLFQVLGNLAWVTLAAGAVAVFVGVVNVKDFFAFEQGLTLSIPESRKPDIYRRARAILSVDNLPAMVAATVFLAIAANFYELLCTAGFPMVYTRLLTLSELPPAGYYLYLALYNLIYVVPLGLIVLVFVRSMGARKLTEREGRLLKLLSGSMMLELGTLLLVAPEWLNKLTVAFGLLGIAVAITWIAAWMTRGKNA
ncbi:thioredoxin family protein [Sulfuricella sp.]|uniref:thioredoxin family protein n=1 Tax=Sulfuricella sp. TaxID=2099377 RepID=UPI002BA98376|nr:thioredoxin family protein [Sulfuricella sp.]HUX63485.1 thioredoxin family protein [Sulfuricella sp.]